MAKLKSAQRLSSISLQSAIKLIVAAIESSRLAEEDLAVLRCHVLGNVSAQVCCDLLLSTMSDCSLSPATKVGLFERLFDGAQRCASFTYLNEAFYEGIVAALKRHGSGLERLDLRGVWVRGEPRRQLCRALRTTLGATLTALSIPYCADDRLLEAVALGCGRIATLDIQGSEEVTPDGLRKLWSTKNGPGKSGSSLSETLVVLNLGCQGSDPLPCEVVCEALQSLPLLVSLGGYPLAGRAVAESQGRHCFSLKYVHDRGTSCATLSALSARCPQLSRCFLDSPDKGVVRHLILLRNLRRLKLSRCNSDELHSALETLPQLEWLELVTLRGELDLSRLSRCCGRALRRFEVFYCKGGVFVSSAAELRFPVLSHLTIYDTPSAFTCKPLLKSCPSVESITLSDCNDLTDEEFFNILDVNPLSSCKSVWLLRAPRLTIQTARCIMTCLENVEAVGRLDCWGLESAAADVNCLRQEAEEANLDFNVWEHFDPNDAQPDDDG